MHTKPYCASIAESILFKCFENGVCLHMNMFKKKCVESKDFLIFSAPRKVKLEGTIEGEKPYVIVWFAKEKVIASTYIGDKGKYTEHCCFIMKSGLLTMLASIL